MKLILAALFLFSSVVMAAETPSISMQIDENKTVTLTVYNNDVSDLTCHYTVTWFENVLTYKRNFGTIMLPASQEVSVRFKNDIAAKISKLHAKVKCD